MLHFIPAWYEKNQWCEHEQCWQERRMHTEFDDTVKHIQLFHRKQPHPFRMLLLSYTPNFRHFLHRQSVYHAPYWSCFDAVQEVQREKAMVLSFHNLSWPEDIEFLYTPYVVVAMQQGRKYAQVEFGEDGNMIRVEMYKNNIICRRNIYDDRGFVSSTTLYDKGEPVCQSYLMENGEWKMRHFLKDGHVEINPKCPQFRIEATDAKSKVNFTQLRYDSMEEVICEVFAAYVQKMPESDAFCVAMHEQHIPVIKKVLLGKRKTVLSFYTDRYDPTKHVEAKALMEQASCLITDSQESTEQILRMDSKFQKKMTDISPYDTRVDLGNSQQLSIQKIMVPVEGLSDERFKPMIVYLGRYLKANHRARIHLFTRKADEKLPRELLQKVRSCLEENELSSWIVDINQGNRIPDSVEEEESDIRFYVEQCVDELSVSRCMKEQRVIVDMRELPELYLQILAISMGIPQIVSSETQFVEDHKNGLIIDEFSNILEALEYYLGGLANWNSAVVASYELSAKFSTNVLIEKWKEVFDFIG